MSHFLGKQVFHLSFRTAYCAKEEAARGATAYCTKEEEEAKTPSSLVSV